MRKLRHIDEEEISFINRVIDSTKKRKADEGLPESQTYKGRCKAVMTNHEEYIRNYDKAFESNKLEALENTHPVLSPDTQLELKDLYSYSRKVIVNLRESVLTEDGYKISFCPLCEINLANTMDHLCNGHKSDTITDGTGKRKFWNAYLDTPPEEEYLFGDVIEREGLPWVKFRIEQGKIDDETFRLLQNTMNPDGQKMFSVYENAEGKFIYDLLKHCIGQFQNCGTLSFDECIKSIKNDIKNNFTLNNCEDVVKLALIESPIFLKCVEEKLNERNIPYKK